MVFYIIAGGVKDADENDNRRAAQDALTANGRVLGELCEIKVTTAPHFNLLSPTGREGKVQDWHSRSADGVE